MRTPILVQVISAINIGISIKDQEDGVDESLETEEEEKLDNAYLDPSLAV